MGCTGTADKDNIASVHPWNKVAQYPSGIGVDQWASSMRMMCPCSDPFVLLSKMPNTRASHREWLFLTFGFHIPIGNETSGQKAFDEAVGFTAFDPVGGKERHRPQLALSGLLGEFTQEIGFAHSGQTID